MRAIERASSDPTTSPMDGSHSLLFRSDSSLALRCPRGPSTPSFDDLVGGGKQRRRHVEAEAFGRSEIDDPLELGRRLDRQVARLLALEDAIDVPGPRRNWSTTSGP